MLPRYEEALLMPAPPLNQTTTTPLATSSPPIDRSQPTSNAPIGSQHSLGLPFTTSTRTSLHDYENMRYPAVRKRRASRPPGQQPETGSNKFHRDSSVIDGELLLKKQSITSSSSRSVDPSHPTTHGGAADAVSLVSEVLDAEVTALTNSSPGSSNGSTERKSTASTKAILQLAKRNLEESHSASSTLATTPDQRSSNSTTSSSGIVSKNQTTSTNLSSTLSTSSGTTSGISAGTMPPPPPSLTAQPSQLSIDTSKAGLEPIPEGTHLYYYYDNLPFYENWPPPKQCPPPVRPRHPNIHMMYQYVPPPEAASIQLIPPLTPHQSLGQVAKPQHPARPSSSYSDQKMSDSPGAADTSLDTPPSHAGGFGQNSRPGSAHSAPLLDLSIDRHYEFDSARTPTDDIGLHNHEANQPLLLLPQKWNRPYLGYNPRRDRELGAAASAANRERVFSDSEIYSPVFPRGRPEPRVDITARVLAMKKEFAEYKQQLQQQQTSPSTSASGTESGGLKAENRSPVSPAAETTKLRASPATVASRLSKDAADRLESLI